MLSSSSKNRYKKLGDALLRMIGEERTQSWLAAQAYVSSEAVHRWVSGQSRPAPDRLGRIAALFKLNPIDLASLAEYDDNPNALDKLQAAYKNNLVDTE